MSGFLERSIFASGGLMEIENLIRSTARAVGLMEIENLIRSTALAVGLKPPAMRGEARLRGLYRIISSKSISPRLWNAKPACPSESGLFLQRSQHLLLPAALTTGGTPDILAAVRARHAVPLAPPGAPMNADHASIATGGDISHSTALQKAFGRICSRLSTASLIGQHMC